MDNNTHRQSPMLSQSTIASIVSAAGIASSVHNSLFKSVVSLAPFQNAFASMSALRAFDTSVFDGYNAIAKAAIKNALPAFEASAAFSKALEGVLDNFQVNLPVGFLPSFEGLVKNEELAGAIAGISELIVSGEISAEVIQEAEELTADVPMFFKPPSELADKVTDLALLLTSARVLVVAVCVIAVLGIYNREIDIEEAILTLVLSFAGKDISGQVVDTVKKRRR